MSISEELTTLAADLRDVAGKVTPAAWQMIRPLANKAEELAHEAERAENLEASFIDGAREAGHGHQDIGAMARGV